MLIPHLMAGVMHARTSRPLSPGLNSRDAMVEQHSVDSGVATMLLGVFDVLSQRCTRKKWRSLSFLAAFQLNSLES